MEKTVILSRGELKIFCKQTEPDCGEIRRVVLSVHGFAGSTEDAIQTSIAEEMEIFSSAIVRFDFPGHGRSPMTDAFFTLRNCRESLMAAAEYARQQYPDVETLCIFASGFGAYVMMHETLLALGNISRPTFQAMGEFTIPTARPLTIRYSFYEELLENSALVPHRVPMLILHGEFDSYIPRTHIQNLRRINENAKLVIIPGASHRFLEDGAWDMVLDLTRDWFAFAQVLVTDWE